MGQAENVRAVPVSDPGRTEQLHIWENTFDSLMVSCRNDVALAQTALSFSGLLGQDVA